MQTDRILSKPAARLLLRGWRTVADLLAGNGAKNYRESFGGVSKDRCANPRHLLSDMRASVQKGRPVGGCKGYGGVSMPGTLIILNPTAGGGRAGRLWPRLESRLRQALGPFELMRTSRIGEATEIAARSDGSHLVVACGGDGTIHEVANGILSRKEPTSLGILSIGTGGDLIKSLRIPSDLLGQIDVLSKGSEQAIDVGEIHYSTPVGMKRRLFLNIADAGLGADVLRRLATTRSVFGRRLAYLSASLEAYRNRQPAKMTVTLDGKKIWEQSTLIAVVANGRSFGGGMQIAPAADLRDGLFEIVLMQDLPP